MCVPFGGHNVIVTKTYLYVDVWCNDNLLTINVKKSHWMKLKVLGEALGHGVHIDKAFIINGKELKQVESINTWGCSWMTV